MAVQIREQDPLKQGLKHIKVIFMKYNKIIREQDPLKQGLKLLIKKTWIYTKAQHS